MFLYCWQHQNTDTPSYFTSCSFSSRHAQFLVLALLGHLTSNLLTLSKVLIEKILDGFTYPLNPYLPSPWPNYTQTLCCGVFSTSGKYECFLISWNQCLHWILLRQVTVRWQPSIMELLYLYGTSDTRRTCCMGEQRWSDGTVLGSIQHHEPSNDSHRTS